MENITEFVSYIENITEFVSYIENNIYSLTIFNLSCIYKDICLRNYKYYPKLNVNVPDLIIHEWQHIYYPNLTHMYYPNLTLDVIRKILVNYVAEILNDIQSKLICECQEPNDEKFEELQRKIKKISEICCMIKKGVLFKEFIDNYRLGYFN